jgi:anti-anti-sigma regulatory factor
MSSEQAGIEVKYEGSITVFIVRGEITLLDAPELKKSVEEAIRKGARKLLFDFENLMFIDSIHNSKRKMEKLLIFIYIKI